MRTAGGRTEQSTAMKRQSIQFESELPAANDPGHPGDQIFAIQIERGQSWIQPVGQACEAVTGYARREFAADPKLWFQLIEEQDRERVAAWQAKAVEGEPVSPLEH